MKKITLLLLITFFALSLQAKDKIKVACVGNSVTYGYLLPDREKNAYPSQLQNLLGKNYDVQNFGKSGSTLLTKGHRPYVEQEEYQKALDFAADIVVIHLGLNDTDPRNWPNYKDDFFENYIDLINAFKEKNPKARVLICRMSPITYKHPRFVSGTRDWYNQIQETIESVADYANVELIDLQKNLYNRVDLLPDALHPTAEGAQLIAEAVYGAITGNYGGLQMPIIYSDNMVLQRNTPLKIQGVANANEKVTVNIGKQKISTKTKADGTWDVTLNPLTNKGPYTLTISTQNKTLSYKNVLAGEVWLCSGQSNMAFLLSGDADFKAHKKDYTANENLRFFNMQPRWETYPIEWTKSALDSINRLEYYSTKGWESFKPNMADEVSAVAYYFGKMLSDSLDVPVGLICNAVGGSTLESWVERSSLEEHMPEILTDWTNNDFIQEWARGRAKLNMKQSENSEQRHPYQPSYLFEAGILPLKSYPIQGVIWYQGESNAHNIEAYNRLFSQFVASWRKQWNNDELPIHYVQLSSLNRPSWPSFRENQRSLMNKYDDIYMTVSSDRGDSLDVHPTFKKDIGERLAFSALNKTYNKTNITPSGPLFKDATFRKNDVVLSFLYDENMHPATGNELIGFEVAEVDGLYYPAEAKVENGQIIVYSDKVKHPKFVRYAWQPYTRANVVNHANLPMSTFKAKK